MRLAWRRVGFAVLSTGLLYFVAASRSQAEENPTIRQQLVKARLDWIAAGKHGPKEKSTEVPNFGTTAETAVEVQSYAFQAGISTDVLLDDGNAYRYFGVANDPYIAAPVQIPTGVMIDFIKLSDCDVNDGDLVMSLNDGQANGNPATSLAVLNSVRGGCGTDSAPVNYLYTQSAHHPLYFVIFFANNPLDGSVKFNNAQVYYHRVVSPAPATSDFGDVSTSDPQFQYIEALFAAGITGGCGGGNYCPTNPVTRGQMAVFLSKALGLHWPF